MGGQHRRPGDPYDVGFGKPPKQTRFKKGRSGNPNGRPRKKPDFYLELTRVLRENVTITVDGELQRVTVQQALLKRLRDQALRGEVWAGKLLQKVIEATPESATEYDRLEFEVRMFRSKALLGLMLEGALPEEADQHREPTEDDNGE
jgi:hypothetical protein